MDFLDFTAGTDLTRHQAELKPWMGEKRFILVTCPDGQTSPLLEEAIENCMAVPRYALDLETTGLDVRVFNGETRDKIVGVCLSHDGHTGYYIPLRHQDGDGNPSPHNIPMHVFRPQFERLMNEKNAAIFHNGKFDQEFLQFNGGAPWREWDTAAEWEDTMILAYLRDSRAKQKGLKFLSKTELDMEMIELHELFGHEKEKKNFDYNFSKLDPTNYAVLAYACSDAICTFLLFNKLYPQVIYKGVGSQTDIYKIEKLCVAATRWMERDRVYIDKNKVAELIDLGQKELFDSLCAVYEAVNEVLGRDVTPFYFLYAKEMIKFSNPNLSITSGTESLHGLLKTCKEMADTLVPEGNFPNLTQYRGRQGVEKRGKDWPAEYDVMSAQQLGALLDELQVPGLEYTEKSGQVKTDSDSLDKLLGIKDDSKKDGEDVENVADVALTQRFPWLAKIRRFRETQKALSTYLLPLWEDMDPTDNTVKINFNAFKTDTGRFSAPASKDPKRDGGTRFPAHGTPATYDPSRPECMGRIRECISARPGRLLCAIDFSGEELRIITNMSGEPKWLTEFFRCSSCDMTFDRGDGVETPPAPPPFCPKCGSDKIGDIHTLTALSLYGPDAPKREDWKHLRGMAKCVDPDTLAFSSEGLIALRTLPLGAEDTFQKSPQAVAVLGKGGFTSVLETYNGGMKEMYHVVTRRGVVTCSAQHRFLMEDGSLRAICEGLSAKDRLMESETPPLPSGSWGAIPHRSSEDVPTTLLQTTPDLAYFAGVFSGDGCKQGKNAIGIAHGDIKKTDKMGLTYLAWQELLAESCERVGFRPIHRKNNLYLGSRSVMRVLSSLSLVDGVDGGRTLRIPPWVLQAGRDGILHFLGGLLDTDGYVSLQDGAIRWCTKDAVFAGQIAAALMAVGVCPSIHPSWNKTYQRDYFVVGIRASGVEMFRDYCRHPGKIRRLAARAHGTSLPNQVLKIIPAGLRPCMDLHVEAEDHIYWANGLLTHNSTNFALCYGGSGKAVVRSTGVDDNEGSRIKAAFDSSYTTLAAWWRRTQDFGREHGFVLTALGRKYPVPDIQLPRWGINPKTKERTNNGAYISKAERNAVNGPIQGGGADIIKYAMYLCYKECKKRGWFNKVSMILTVHDELVFDIDKDILEEAIEAFSNLMCNNPALKALKWRVPLTCDIECGPTWMVQWHITKMLNGKKKWPDELKPYFPKSIGAAAVEGEVVADATVQAKVEVQTDVEATEPKPASGIYTYTIQGALTAVRAYKLAEAIAKCSGRGTSKLRILTADGTEIDYGQTANVNHTEFKFKAQDAGL